MQQPEKSAAETEAKRERGLGLEHERGIVQLELLKVGAQFLVLVRLHRVHSRKEHRLHLLEPGNSLAARIRDGRNRVSDLHLAGGLDSGNYISHTSAGNLVARTELHLQRPHLVGDIFLARVEELDLVAGADGSVHDLEVGYDAPEGVEHGVENQGLKRRVRVSLRRRDSFHNRVQNILHSLSGLSRSQKNLLVGAAYHIDNLIRHDVNHRRFHVNLVQHRDNLKSVLHGKIEV